MWVVSEQGAIELTIDADGFALEVIRMDFEPSPGVGGYTVEDPPTATAPQIASAA